MRLKLSFIRLAALACVVCAAGGAGSPVVGRALPTISGEYLQTVWTTEDGLPQNSVNAILQTRDGYLWVATFGGLARFDGVKFTIFNTGNTPALKSNRISALCEDREGNLWIGTHHGGLTRYRQGTFTNFSTQDGLPDDFIASLAEDGEGGIFVGTGSGLARFHAGRLTSYSTNDGLPRVKINAICEDRAGNLWLGTWDGGLIRYGAGAVTTYTREDGLPSDRVDAIREAGDGSLWVGTGAGLVRLEDGKLFLTPEKDGRPVGPVSSIHEDHQGGFWVSAERGLFHLSHGELTEFTRKGDASDQVKSLLVDREENLWVGTNVGGLVRWRKRNLITYTTEQGLSHDNVTRIYEDGEGNVWIGTNGGGLNRFKDGKFTAGYMKNGLPATVWSLGGDREGNVWVGSFEYGLASFKDGRLTRYTAAQGLSQNAVYSIYEDADGALWIGTEGGGLNRFESGRFTAYRTTDGLLHDQVSFITQDRQGALWLGTAGGLSRFKDGRFTNYGSEVGLSLVRAVHEDADGTLWVGTYGYGLSRFKDGKFTRSTEHDGLFEDVVSRILEDDHGNLWMSGNRGIYRVSRQELNDFADGKLKKINCVSYGTADGMKVGETNGGGQPAGWKTRDGKLWFPTIEGVAVVDPNVTNRLPPPVRIEGVTIDREALPADQLVELKPGQEGLEIHYAGLSFSRPERVKFKYQLIGLDTDWVDADTRRTAYYSYLPPGTYTFRVIAENGDGVWSEAAATLAVVVRPPFWRTWWFVSLCALCVAGVAFAAYRWRVAQLKRRHAAQEDFSRRLINAHESERRRVAAELHDGLGQSLAMIKNSAVFGEQAVGDLAAAKEQFARISAQSAQAIGEVREITSNLRPYLLDRLGLTKAIGSMLNKVADTDQIKLTVDVDELDGLFTKDAEMSIYRIIQESLNNILKHSGASEAKVAAKKSGREVTITIQDNGQGFDSSAPGDGDAGRRGFGLLGISERVRMLGGTHTIQSAPGQGTTITISINTGDRGKGKRSDDDDDSDRDG